MLSSKIDGKSAKICGQVVGIGDQILEGDRMGN